MKEFHRRQSRFNVFNPTLTYQILTKFDELNDILTDAGQDDFFQATYSEDQIPTSSELAEGLSTNVPASSRIPTVI